MREHINIHCSSLVTVNVCIPAAQPQNNIWKHNSLILSFVMMLLPDCFAPHLDFYRLLCLSFSFSLT